MINTFYLSQMILSIGNASEKSNNPNDRAVFKSLLASSGLLLSRIQLNKELKDSISAFEKLISNLWIENEGQFNAIYENWKYFKDAFYKELSGMTVNERLFFLGLFDDFDQSVSSKNKDRLRYVLNQINITDDNISQIIEQSIK